MRMQRLVMIVHAMIWNAAKALDPKALCFYDAGAACLNQQPTTPTTNQPMPRHVKSHPTPLRRVSRMQRIGGPDDRWCALSWPDFDVRWNEGPPKSISIIFSIYETIWCAYNIQPWQNIIMKIAYVLIYRRHHINDRKNPEKWGVPIVLKLTFCWIGKGKAS